MISDHLPEVRELFGDAVATYHDPPDLRRLVDAALLDIQAARARAVDGRQAVLAGHTFDHRAQRSTAASYEYQARNVCSIQELFRARSSFRVICHNVHHQRRLFTQQLDEHRPESTYDRVTVADPGTTVDDQQDSFSYWHRIGAIS